MEENTFRPKKIRGLGNLIRQKAVSDFIVANCQLSDSSDNPNLSKIDLNSFQIQGINNILFEDDCTGTNIEDKYEIISGTGGYSGNPENPYIGFYNIKNIECVLLFKDLGEISGNIKISFEYVVDSGPTRIGVGFYSNDSFQNFYLGGVKTGAVGIYKDRDLTQISDRTFPYGTWQHVDVYMINGEIILRVPNLEWGWDKVTAYDYSYNKGLLFIYMYLPTEGLASSFPRIRNIRVERLDDPIDNIIYADDMSRDKTGDYGDAWATVSHTNNTPTITHNTGYNTLSVLKSSGGGGNILLPVFDTVINAFKFESDMRMTTRSTGGTLQFGISTPNHDQFIILFYTVTTGAYGLYYYYNRSGNTYSNHTNLASGTITASGLNTWIKPIITVQNQEITLEILGNDGTTLLAPVTKDLPTTFTNSFNFNVGIGNGGGDPANTTNTVDFSNIEISRI